MKKKYFFWLRLNFFSKAAIRSFFTCFDLGQSFIFSQVLLRKFYLCGSYNSLNAKASPSFHRANYF